jgi:hypothetical protein
LRSDSPWRSKVYRDLVQRVGDILVGLDHDLVFHLRIGERGDHFDGLRNYRGSSHSTAFFLRGFQDADCGTNTFAHRIDVPDVLLNHRIGRKRPNHMLVEAIGIIRSAEPQGF